ncbi:carboxypeptidase-like regulatory domain-containing protein [Paenibacillus sp. CC-CFT747]|nr:carboxypeptidase-like regulatory domain-containing protein [Paenibacillus sp. CC-CFT747]
MTLRAVGEDGSEIAYAYMTVKDPAGRSVRQGRALGSGRFPEAVTGLYAGDEWTVSASDPEEKYEGGEQKVTLQPGENSVAVPLKLIVPVRITGTVTDKDGVPVPGAIVSVAQPLKGRPGSYQTRTGDQGEYSVFAYSGKAMINASLPGIGSSPAVTVDLKSGEENRHDPVLETPIDTILDIKLYTKHIGGEWMGPIELDRATAIHFRLWSSHPARNYENPLLVRAGPGETVQVCVDGIEANLPKTCGKATVDANKRASVELRLEERGGRVSGTLSGWNERTDISLFRLLDNGTRRWAGARWAVTIGVSPYRKRAVINWSSEPSTRFRYSTPKKQWRWGWAIKSISDW